MLSRTRTRMRWVALLLALSAGAGAGAQTAARPAAQTPVQAPAQSAQSAPAPAPTPAQAQAQAPAQPVPGTVVTALAAQAMLAAAHPLAARAGQRVLAAGGSAADAAVAVQLLLNLVEPQSSGIGGGSFILYWDATTHRLHAIDGRETAPAGSTPERFLDAQGAALPFWEAAVGGQSVGVPGTLRALETLHALAGKRPWAELFAPAIELAESGFEVSPRLAGAIVAAPHLQRFAAARAYFFAADGRALVAGERLRNPAFASTLRAIAAGGVEAFYGGAVAAAMVAAVNASSNRRDNLSLLDLAGYQARLREPLCVDYRDHQVCGMGPPTSGGLLVGQVLGMLAGHDLAALGWGEAAAHLMAEAMKLAYADRARYLADADFVPVPVAGLLDPAYLRQRGAALGVPRAGPAAAPGVPPGAPVPPLASSAWPGGTGTTHFVIRDADGNAVSMTSSIETGFGSRVMAGGFLLNNQLTDFDFLPHRDGRPVANRVQAGKRPRSSMAPTIVLRDGRPYLLLGSPGGASIPAYVLRSLIGVLEMGMTPQQAVSGGHVVHRNLGVLEVEAGSDAEALVAALGARGHEVRVRALNSGLHVLRIGADGTLQGGADPRREGVVLSLDRP